jgi:hypothetical protein
MEIKNMVLGRSSNVIFLVSLLFLTAVSTQRLAYARTPQLTVATSPLDSFETTIQSTVCDSNDMTLSSRRACYDILKQVEDSWFPFFTFSSSPLHNLETLARAGQAICQGISAEPEKRSCFRNVGTAFTQVGTLYRSDYEYMRFKDLNGDHVDSDLMNSLERAANLANLENQRLLQLDSEFKKGTYERLYGELLLSAETAFEL